MAATPQHSLCPAMYLHLLHKDIDQLPASTLQIRTASYLLLIKYTFSYDSGCFNAPQKSSGCSQATVWIAADGTFPEGFNFQGKLFMQRCNQGAIGRTHVHCICKYPTANCLTQTLVSFKTMALWECCLSLTVITYLLGTWLPVQTEQLTVRQRTTVKLTGTCYS